MPVVLLEPTGPFLEPGLMHPGLIQPGGKAGSIW